jgi:hypothetical protein
MIIRHLEKKLKKVEEIFGKVPKRMYIHSIKSSLRN